MKELSEVLGLMLDKTTFALAISAILLYWIGLCLVDFWSAISLVTAPISTEMLARSVLWLMKIQTRFRQVSGGHLHKTLWRFAVVLDALCRARTLPIADESARWRAIVLIGQAPAHSAALREVEQFADPRGPKLSERTAAAVLDERAMAMTAGGRPGRLNVRNRPAK
jgi:hypothetical protein